MGWRFRRRVTMFPGVRLNLSARGVSTTFGIPGASVNIGSRGAYLNVGVPGTGLYNRMRLGGPSQPSPRETSPPIPTAPTEPMYFMPTETGAIQSAGTDALTSEGMLGIKETMLAADREREELGRELTEGIKACSSLQRQLTLLKLIPFHRRLLPQTVAEREREFSECQASVGEVQHRLSGTQVKVDLQIDEILFAAFDPVYRAFEQLQNCHGTWDITSSVAADRFRERTVASWSIHRQQVNLGLGALEIIQTNCRALCFGNANGATLYFYPGLLVAYRTSRNFAFIDYRDVEVTGTKTRFIEQESVLTDTEVIGQTWKYANKDGSRDRRFSSNFQIPIVRYGELHFKSNQGLNEVYQFSNADAVVAFAKAFIDFRECVRQKLETARVEAQLPPHAPAHVVHCGQCGQENAEGTKFCESCGVPLFKPDAARSTGQS